MKNRRENRKTSGRGKEIPTRYLLLILSLLCGALFFISLTLNISGGPLQSAAGYIFVPIEKGINRVGLFLSEKADNFKTLKSVIKENEELQQEVYDLTAEITDLKMEQYDAQTYKELLELDEKYSDYPKTAASIIAKDAGNWFSTFTIDKGENDGIETGMNVLAGAGLVGIVTDVGPNYAKVRSIIDDTANVSVMTATTKDNFILTGDLTMMDQERKLPFSELKDEDNAVSVGDPVVTSYISDQYQQGILVGYITEVTYDTNHLTKSGTVTPVVDFEHLTTVLVVTELKVTGQEEDTEE